MLIFKSFKIGDADGINEALKTHNLAKGSSVLITNGEVLVPLEDGAPETVSHKIISINEIKNEHLKSIELIIHSQKVNQLTIDGASAQILKKEGSLTIAKGTKADYKKNKDIEGDIARLRNVISQTETTMLMNQAEITRLASNITVADETIAELSK